MKAFFLLGLTTFISNTNQMSMDMHRRLEDDDNNVKAQLFTLEKSDIVTTKFSIAPVSTLLCFLN